MRHPSRNIGIGVGAAALVFAFTVDPRAQAVAPACGVVDGRFDVDRLVARFLESADEYRRAFRSLTAEETKVLEEFRASSEVEKRREIISDLVVYQTSRDGAEAATEYRDVRSVDGKPVEKRGERALTLLTKAAKAGSLKKELDAIDRESGRYESRYRLRSFAMNQVALPKAWRDRYQVEVAGREQIGGHEVVVLSYRQTAGPTSQMPLPRELGNAPIRQRGRLWLDARTCQVRRRIWELVVSHPDAREPLAVVHSDAAYTDSPFGILVPERLLFEWRQHFRRPKNSPPSLGVRQRTTLTYGKFRRFGVATDEKIDLPERDR